MRASLPNEGHEDRDEWVLLIFLLHVADYAGLR